MTTKDFIAKTYNTGNYTARERRCSSVFTDDNGVVYSYGRHYPLLICIKGLNFVNVTGYSSSTSKHIAWAKAAVHYDYIGVELTDATRAIVSDSFRDDEERLFVILGLLIQRADGIELIMAGKNNKTTQVYNDLSNQLATVTQDIARIKKEVL